MRADSLPRRIADALARDPSKMSPHTDTMPGLPGLPRSSMAGRIVAALARAETASPAAVPAPAFQASGLTSHQATGTTAPRRTKNRWWRRRPEAPTRDAKLTIVVADQEAAKKAPRHGPGGSHSPTRAPVLEEGPTPSAWLSITLSPARR